MASLFSIALLALLASGQQKGDRLKQLEASLKDDIPRMLCVSEDVVLGAQPSDEAFSKLAEEGFRAVLNLRTASEGADLEREAELVQKAGMRYISIPIASNAPDPGRVEDFIRAVKEESNHPMLIHCGSANRASALWMIYRVLEQGWPEEKALEEAKEAGLTNPALIKFARDYIASHKKR
jgi:uncharacterized protein (TIGR01244 family)